MAFGDQASAGALNSSRYGGMASRSRQRRQYSGFSSLARPGRINIARPKYDPIDTTGTTALQKRIADANRLADDPLSAPGVQQQLGVISEGLNRQFSSAQGEAKGRAAQSGQAGFTGGFAQTSAALSGDLANTRAKTQSDMMMDVYNKARAEGLSATEALSAAQNEIGRIKNERSRIEAELSAQEAEVNARQDMEYQQALLNQARLAEDARQFDANDDSSDDEFGFRQRQYKDELRMKERDFGFRERQYKDEQWRDEQRKDEQRKDEQKRDEQRRAADDTNTFGFGHQEYTPFVRRFKTKKKRED